ncbi:MAG: NAD-dependent epimerase/dehydratase family protein [Magnetococcales bacterium]|nr:NAD-dependent epimerase/dehydratase family protein [Magnetococcales bacterium]
MGTYLITGGCGFIGSHLSDALLARGDQVRVLDDLSMGKRENISDACELTVGDVADLETVQEVMKGVDGCFHLAAIASVQRSNEDWLGTHRINQTGSINVFDSARFCRDDGQPAAVVYASSAAIYGDNPNIPLNESARQGPLTAYGADKLGSELHARVAGQAHGVPTLGFRFFNIYGPRQNPDSPYSGVISIFADRIRDGKPIKIFGDGGHVRDFVYVSDVVRFLLAAMEAAKPEAAVWNVCRGEGTTIKDLALHLFAAAGKEVPIEHTPPRAGDILLSIGDASGVEAALNVRAEVSLKEGLKETMRFFNEA